MIPAIDYLNERVEIDLDTGCFNWTGPCSPAGYGHASRWQARRLGSSYRVHRFAWHLLVGPIPEGLTIDHLCRNTRCVNPDHLEVVTMRVNVLRSTNPMAMNARKTHCPKGHPYDAENTRVKPGRRSCWTCDRAGWRRENERRKTVAS